LVHGEAGHASNHHETFTMFEVQQAFAENDGVVLQSPGKGHEQLSRAQSVASLANAEVVQGANMKRNEYGQKQFANFFFFITGFHGFHVFSGVILNIIVFYNTLLGTYERRKSYLMVEKVGLYWHFVDLVWVFVFTFFYLV